MRKTRMRGIQGATNMSAPILITAGAAVTAAVPAAPAPVDINTQIQAAFEARKQILLALTALEGQRADLGRTTALAYSSDVATNGVDPAKAVAARDAWQTKDTQFVTQHDALKQLLELIEARIEEFKRTNPTEVSGVLRDQIAALSEILSVQEKTEHATERQLKLLWNELRDVDPGYLATMAKGAGMRALDESKKSGKDAPKPTGKK
jgi:uncharacterized coiled-coil protein SlyX